MTRRRMVEVATGNEVWVSARRVEHMRVRGFRLAEQPGTTKPVREPAPAPERVAPPEPEPVPDPAPEPAPEMQSDPEPAPGGDDEPRPRRMSRLRPDPPDTPAT